MNRSLSAAGLVAVMALSAVAPGSAQAAVPQVSRQAPSATKYATPVDYVDFVLFGAGPIADRFPDAAAEVRHGQPVHAPSAADLARLVKYLQTADKSFQTAVIVDGQSKDPFVVQGALKRLSDDLTTVLYAPVTSKSSSANAKMAAAEDRMYRPDGWFWSKSNVVALQNVVAVWQVAGAHTVAAVFEAAVVAFIVPAAASYQFEMNSASVLDRENFTAAITMSSPES